MKGQKFAVSGVMYRGEPPMPQPKQDPYRFLSLAAGMVSFVIVLNGLLVNTLLVYYFQFTF